MGQSQPFYRFILLPGFVGLACYACTPAPQALSKETNLNQNGRALSEPVEPTLAKDKVVKTESPLIDAGTDTDAAYGLSLSAYREGINLASSAYSLSQSAVSPDDWSLIASRWQQASAQLKQVDAQDKNYATAQQKIVEYARNASHATTQLEALQQPIRAPTLPSNRPLNQPVVLTTANLPAQPAVNDSDGSGKMQVPVVRRLHGTPVVQVLFNGDRSYEMILDTGASRTLITRQMADELGIVATERMVAATASENEVTFDLGQVRSMSVGEVTLQNARVTIGDSINIGLLGNDFLQGYDITIREETVELAQRL
jgi:predicted aspartyl protease